MGRDRSNGRRLAEAKVPRSARDDRDSVIERRLSSRGRRPRDLYSYLEDPGILRLDLVGHLLDLDRVLAQGLDRTERWTAGLGLDLEVGRILAAQVDEELLALARHDPGE